MDEGANDSRLSSELFNTNMQSTSPKHDLPAIVPLLCSSNSILDLHCVSRVVFSSLETSTPLLSILYINWVLALI